MVSDFVYDLMNKSKNVSKSNICLEYIHLMWQKSEVLYSEFERSYLLSDCLLGVLDWLARY
jgi:hypothetical protein